MKPTIASRKHRGLRLAAAIAVSALLTGVSLLAPVTRPAFSQNVVVLDVDVKEVAKSYRASELTGADVQNAAGEEIGSIDDLIVDREKVLFAILSIGGFLGIGDHLVAIPYNALEINEDGSKIVLAQGRKEELQKLPEFKYQEKK
jgi:sporulation protein YlmC with PRC-barrel domain